MLEISEATVLPTADVYGGNAARRFSCVEETPTRNAIFKSPKGTDFIRQGKLSQDTYGGNGTSHHVFHAIEEKSCNRIPLILVISRLSYDKLLKKYLTDNLHTLFLTNN